MPLLRMLMKKAMARVIFPYDAAGELGRVSLFRDATTKTTNKRRTQHTKRQEKNRVVEINVNT